MRLALALRLERSQHKVKRRAHRGQVIGDGTDDVNAGGIEGEKASELVTSDSLRPAKAALVILVVLVHRGRVGYLAHARQCDVVVVVWLVEQWHQVEPLAGDDIFDASPGLEGLLRRADRPHRQVLYPGQPVGKHHQRLLVIEALHVGAAPHKEGDFVQDQEQTGIALIQQPLDHVPKHIFGLHRDLGADLEIALVKVPQALAAVTLHAGIRVVLQVIQEVVDILPLFFVKKVGVLQEFSQIAAIALEIVRVQETFGQDLGRIERE